MSIMPKAIELAFAVHADKTLPSGSPSVEHALHVWERFRHYRPLGETALARYEELGCIALLHDVVGNRLVGEAQLASDFGGYVASALGRIGAPNSPVGGDDFDWQLIMILARLDTLSCHGETLAWAERLRRIDELEQICLPLVEFRIPDLAREIRFLLEDLRGDRASGVGCQST